jgi:hypothetical protein
MSTQSRSLIRFSVIPELSSVIQVADNGIQEKNKWIPVCMTLDYFLLKQWLFKGLNVFAIFAYYSYLVLHLQKNLNHHRIKKWTGVLMELPYPMTA